MFNSLSYQNLVRQVEKLLALEGYELEVSNFQSRGHDFSGRTPRGKLFIGEFKLYRSRHLNSALLSEVLDRSLELFKVGKVDHVLLVTNAVLNEATKAGLSIFGVDFWDYQVLLDKALKYPELNSDLISALEESQPLSSQSETQYNSYFSTERDISSGKFREKRQSDFAAKVNENNLRLLMHEIKSIPSGLHDAKKFEDKCEEVLKIIFNGELFSWRREKKSESKLHRFDLIARIQSGTDFWLTLQNHFNAKYVVFEFKNYTKKISQKEIFTTEKYLYAKAMRPVAIVISPKGADDHAGEACRGALREHGKVILNLTVDQLIEALEKKIRGEAPSDILVEILDEMLMTIDR